MLQLLYEVLQAFQNILWMTYMYKEKDWNISNLKKTNKQKNTLYNTMMMMSSGLTMHQPMRVICVKMVN